MDAVHVGSHDKEAQHAVQPQRHLDVAVIEHGSGVEQHLENQDRHRRQPNQHRGVPHQTRGRNDSEGERLVRLKHWNRNGYDHCSKSDTRLDRYLMAHLFEQATRGPLSNGQTPYCD
jgi:hypothetical protein